MPELPPVTMALRSGSQTPVYAMAGEEISYLMGLMFGVRLLRRQAQPQG